MHIGLTDLPVSRNFRESPEMALDLQVSRNCKKNLPELR